MATQSKSNDEQDSPLIDRDRWDGDVVATEHGTLTWGTHRQRVWLQVFGDGSGNLQISAPSSPPVYAREWIADWLNGSDIEHAAAHLLAQNWYIDIEQVQS